MVNCSMVVPNVDVVGAAIAKNASDASNMYDDTLPGCLCLPLESCNACTSLSPSHTSLDLWSHLAVIKKCYQAKETAVKRKRTDSEEDWSHGCCQWV